MALTWTNERRRLSDLVPWPRNPRQIREDQAARLSESLEQFGQVDIIAIGPENEVFNGHQRLNVWAADHGPDLEVDVRVASRSLTEKEREKLTVFLHRGAAGEWDFDTLANEFELDELLEWGFEGWELGLDLEEPDEPEGEQYSRKIESPVYEPSNIKPGIDELFDESKTESLIEAIQAARGLADKERAFLVVAARRHTVLRYDKIADYYAHSGENVQRLMEDSALVIIDFNRAIDLGYVELAEEIAKQYGLDYGVS